VASDVVRQHHATRHSVKLKLKFTLEQAAKTQGRSRGIAVLFL
jgi:hypothetical protein